MCEQHMYNFSFTSLLTDLWAHLQHKNSPSPGITGIKYKDIAIVNTFKSPSKHVQCMTNIISWAVYIVQDPLESFKLIITAFYHHWGIPAPIGHLSFPCVSFPSP